MKTFRTGKHTWDLSLNVAKMKRVKSLTDIDLMSVIDNPEVLHQLTNDPMKLVDVLFAVIKPQADAVGVTDEDFAGDLDGEAIETGVSALLEALVDFFPGARRAMLRRVMDKANKYCHEADAKLQAMLNDGTIDKAIDDALTVGSKSNLSQAVAA